MPKAEQASVPDGDAKTSKSTCLPDSTISKSPTASLKRYHHLLFVQFVCHPVHLERALSIIGKWFNQKSGQVSPECLYCGILNYHYCERNFSRISGRTNLSAEKLRLRSQRTPSASSRTRSAGAPVRHTGLRSTAFHGV